MSMYGARDAASNWGERYSRVLIDIGFKEKEDPEALRGNCR